MQLLYLDTKFDQETTSKIVEAGFSRVPVAFSKEYPIVVGILLVKTVLAVEHTSETISELYKQGKINLKLPSYFTHDANLSKVSTRFNEGFCHMGIVCETREIAHSIRDFNDYVHTQLVVEGKEPQVVRFDLKDKKILGLLTLEDVIEKTLRIDIADEGDLDEAVKAFQMRNLEARDMNQSDLVPYMHMRYALENDTVANS